MDEVIVFGAGTRGQEVQRLLSGFGVRTASYCDNDPFKQGTEIDGIPVIGPADLSNHPTLPVIVTALGSAGAIKEQLAELGVRCYLDAQLLLREHLSYPQICRQFLGAEIPDRAAWELDWSFRQSSPESKTLLNAMERAKFELQYSVSEQYLRTLQQEGIDGDVVEFGVHFGRTLDYFATICEKLGDSRRCFGFDGFQGLPKPTEFDPAVFSEGQYRSDFETVSLKLRTAERPQIRLVPGWFDQTLSRDSPVSAQIEHVAFAHIDCDLYESTRPCLDFLTDRLVDGAFLLFDDWTHHPEIGETKAFFEWCDQTQERFKLQHLANFNGACHFRVRLR